ncbi:MAG: M48 family metalloprotease [Planctomycetota bacterium]
MPSFLILYTVCSTLILAELLRGDPSWQLASTLTVLVSSVLLVAALGKLSTWLGLRFGNGLKAQSTEEVWDRMLRIGHDRPYQFLCIAYPLLLYASDAIAWANGFRQAGWHLAFATLLFAPHLVFCLSIAWVAAQVDGYFGESVLERWRLRLRLGAWTNTVVCLVPLFLIMTISDLMNSQMTAAIPFVLRILSCIGVVLLCLASYPTFLSFWMGCRDLDQPKLQMRIERLRNALGIRKCKVRIVSSNETWNSAAVVGWIPWGRQLWLGDGLVEHLTSAEIDMVVLHELAHIRLLHFFNRLLPALWSALIGTAVLLGLNILIGTLWANGAAALVISSIVLVVGLAWVSRKCEYEADIWAAGVAAENCEWAHGCPKAAAESLLSALCKLTPDTAANRVTLLHPSFLQREAQLAHALSYARAESLQTVGN